MKAFGVVLRDLPGPVPTDLVSALEAVIAVGAGRLQLPSVAWLSADLDPRSLSAARTAAADRGVRLSAQLGVINAVDAGRMEPLLQVGGGDALRGVAKTAAAAASAGIDDLHFTIGVLADREDRTITWDERLERSARLIDEASVVAQQHGVRLVLKTHEEMSSHDVLAVVGATDGRIGVGLSPVNLLVGLEDPTSAARRLSRDVVTLFIDDAALVDIDRGFERRMAPVGGGIVDWLAIRALCPDADMVLDVHHAEFTVDWRTPGWLARHPHVTLEELSMLIDGAKTAEHAPAVATWAERFDAGVTFLRGLGAPGATP